MVIRINWRIVVLIALVGFFVVLVTGLVEINTNQPSEDNNKNYGFPLVWRIVDNTGLISVHFPEFFSDWGFGIVITSFMLWIARRTEKAIMKKNPPLKKKSVHRSVDS